MQYLTISARLMLNVHDLNNEATAGNVSDIRMIDYIDLEGNRREAPAVSGRMLKHWHVEALRGALPPRAPLCDSCAAGEPLRPGEWQDVKDSKTKETARKLVLVSRPEAEAVQKCVVCDMHGYLIARGAQSTQETPEEETAATEKGVSERRNSRVMFSWLLPVLDGDPDVTSRQVIHNRVADLSVAEDRQAMMPYNKSYASGIYGFVSVLDAGRVGYVETIEKKDERDVLQPQDKASRLRAAVEAYRSLLTGKMGASLSHALPHADCRQVVVAASTAGPLPAPISPIYPDYLAKYVGLLPDHGRLWAFGFDSVPEGVTSCATLNELFAAIAGLIPS